MKKSKKNLKYFFRDLYKIGYRYFKIKKRVKKDQLVVKAFQQRYLPKKVTGKIDKKTQEIANLLDVKFQTTLLIFKDNNEIYRSLGETTEDLIYEALKKAI